MEINVLSKKSYVLYNPQCWKMGNYKKAVMIQDDKIRSALNYHRWKWHPSKEKMTCSRHHTTSDSSLLPRINPSGAFSWISFWPLLLLYCAAQAFFAAKRCIEDKKHTRRVLGHVNLFKSLVSEINLLHWLDNTAVLCTNYYCSDSSSRTKIWLDGAHHRKSDKKQETRRALPLDIIAGAIFSFS